MVNIGFIGVGRMAKVHIRNIVQGVDNATITAAADPYMNEETENWLKSIGVQKVYKDCLLYTSSIKAANMTDKIAVCGFDGFQVSIQAVANGEEKMIIGQKPYWMGQELSLIHI